MKRIIALVLTLVMLCGALISCNNKEKVDLSTVTKLEDLKGATIAAQTGTFHLQALESQTKDVTVKELPDFDQLLVALKAGTIDGYVAEEPTAFSVVAQNEGLDYIPLKNNTTGFTASDADTGIAVAFKTGSSYVASVNAIIDAISSDTRSALMEQVVKMSAAPETALTEALVLVSDNTSTANGTLKIAMECAYEPFNWSQTNDANGAVKINGSNLYANGYDVQIAKYIAAELGMALEIHAVEWDSLIPGLNAGTYDGIIAGMSPTAEREEKVDFTNCYYNSNLVIIYKKQA
ncbi:MAG: transporter substrate-binding domain-containing protein [Clostridia bacterium]|nr:transporter substrate-binding domain-containing protein [Clostridia bacterium]